MTPLPKRRWSSRRQGKKRASLAAFAAAMVKCPNCGKPRPAHAVCPSCGFYKGKQVLTIKSKKSEEKPSSA